jgi:ABC-type sugar transport system ATPase subunit
MFLSGSGKTTLLNVLNFRNSNLLVEGDVKMNGKTISWRDLSRYSAYVQQDDVYIATLTVKEHLTFLVIIFKILVVLAASLPVFIDIIELDLKAVLKMDKSLPRSAKDARIEEVMTDVNIRFIFSIQINNGLAITIVSFLS